MKIKIEMNNKKTDLLITLDEEYIEKQKEKDFEKWLLLEIEKKFGKKVIIDKRTSESAKQI